MTSVKRLQTSFASGEITSELFSRVDLRQYVNGAAEMKNFIPLPQGAATVRPGFEYVNDASRPAGTSRLIPYIETTGTAYALEIGVETLVSSTVRFVRFHTSGGTLKYAISQVADNTVTDNKFTFAADHGFVEDDVVRVVRDGVLATHPTNVEPDAFFKVNLIDRRTIKLKDITSGAIIAVASGGSGGSLRVYKATEIPAIYREARRAVPGITGVAPGANYFTVTDHGFASGEPIRVKPTGAETLPSGLVAGKTYYAKVETEDIFRVAEYDANGNLAGVDITTTGGVSGTYVYRFYTKGTIYYDALGSGATGYSQFRYVNYDHDSETNPSAASSIIAPTDDQELEILIGGLWTEADIDQIRYAQDGNTMTLVAPSMIPVELRREVVVDGPYGIWDGSDAPPSRNQTKWSVSSVVFGSTAAAPSAPTVAATRGGKALISAYAHNTHGGIDQYRYDFNTGSGLAVGDTVYIENPSPSDVGLTNGTFYFVSDVEAANSLADKQVWFRNIDGSVLAAGTTTGGGLSADVYFTTLNSDNTNEYKVTAVDDRDNESVPSPSTSVTNNLFVEGSFNTVSWAASDNAQRYRVYKKKNGLFGFIGEVDSGLEFKDDNIDPDLEATPPIADASVQEGNVTNYNFKPSAVTYYQQRRWFAGTSSEPQTLWGSRSGSVADFSYSMPILDTDRINAMLSARIAQKAKHLIALDSMLMLSQSGEWRVTGDKTGVTPSNIAMSNQAEIGAADPTPVIINNTVVYAAARGGHLRQLNFRFERQSWTGGDISLRAAHLFNGYQIEDMTFAKAPYPLIYVISSSGKLLSVTFLPEEELSAVAQHTTSGTFLSCCSIPDGDEDRLYALVERTKSDGSKTKLIERMAKIVSSGLDEDAVLDAFSSTYSTATRTGSFTIARGTGAMMTGDLVDLTSTTGFFVSGDVDRDISMVSSDGTAYRMTVTEVTSATAVVCKLKSDMTLTQDGATFTSYRWYSSTFTVPSWMNGLSVTVNADGDISTKTVASGSISLTDEAVYVRVGLPYTATLKTMPLALQVQAASHGQTKNINRAWVRVFESAGLQIGPDTDSLVPVESLTSTKLTTGETRTNIKGDWTDDGQIVIQQSQPLPATVVGLTLQITLGS
jgi:hypothetical protein